MGYIIPEPIADFFDIIILGEGELVVPQVMAVLDSDLNRNQKLTECSKIEGVYVPNIYGTPQYNDDESVEEWDIDPIRKTHIPSIDINDGFYSTSEKTTGHNIYYSIEAGRGCQSKCNFCSIAWTCGKYRETSPANLKKTIQSIQNKTGKENISLTLSAPDSAGFKCSKEFSEILYNHNVRNRFASVKLNSLKENIDIVLSDPTIKLRIGIEGYSERLRKAMGKPLTNNEIIEGMQFLIDHDMFNFQFFMISGLPGENEEDFKEFNTLLNELGEIESPKTTGGTWLNTITFTNFNISPHSPCQWFGSKFSQASYDFYNTQIKNSFYPCMIPKIWPTKNKAPFFLESILLTGNRKLTYFLLSYYKKKNILQKIRTDKERYNVYHKLLSNIGYNPNIVSQDKSLDYNFCWDFIEQEIPRKVIVKRHKRIREELKI